MQGEQAGCSEVGSAASGQRDVSGSAGRQGASGGGQRQGARGCEGASGGAREGEGASSGCHHCASSDTAAHHAHAPAAAGQHCAAIQGAEGQGPREGLHIHAGAASEGCTGSASEGEQAASAAQQVARQGSEGGILGGLQRQGGASSNGGEAAGICHSLLGAGQDGGGSSHGHYAGALDVKVPSAGARARVKGGVAPASHCGCEPPRARRCDPHPVPCAHLQVAASDHVQGVGAIHAGAVPARQHSIAARHQLCAGGGCGSEGARGGSQVCARGARQGHWASPPTHHSAGGP